MEKSITAISPNSNNGAATGTSESEQSSNLHDRWVVRAELAVAVVTQFAILLIAVTSLMTGQWFPAFSGSVVFLLTFAPAVIERQLHVRLPVEVTVFTCIFLYASFALGEVQQFYDRVWWWDLALHGSSAFVIGLIGFLTVYIFYMTFRIRVAPLYIAMISFGFAVTVGTLWEIFEFLMDWFFGMKMQRSSLVDTMTDLMINCSGALLSAAISYYYVRYEDTWLKNWVTRHLRN